MHKIITGFFLIATTASVWAGTSYEPLLNQVTVPFYADKWIKTATPLVTIGIDASVNDSDMGDVQGGLLANLKKLSSDADWHITSFNRSEDPSGLEKVQALAEARLPESALAGLRDRVKKISRPGETYTLINIAFTPTEVELRAANEGLRADIYQQIDAEIARLNKAFSDQKYFLHQLRFMGAPEVQPFMAQAIMLNAREVKGASVPLQVSNHIVVNGSAVLASAPSSEVVQLVHGKSVSGQ